MGMFNGPGADGLHGTNGANGTKPDKPPQAPTGNPGKDAECSTWGDEAPTNGGPGYNGGVGATGGSGQHGTDGQDGGAGVVQTIDGTLYSGTITLKYRGGRGGNGGTGGNGGEGGDGAQRQGFVYAASKSTDGDGTRAGHVQVTATIAKHRRSLTLSVGWVIHPPFSHLPFHVGRVSPVAAVAS